MAEPPEMGSQPAGELERVRRDVIIVHVLPSHAGRVR